jgi:hypothetical protein
MHLALGSTVVKAPIGFRAAPENEETIFSICWTMISSPTILSIIVHCSSLLTYDAHLFVSKIPETNFKIDVERFNGSLQTEIDGTITDHFTFCLVLLPARNQTPFNFNSTMHSDSSIYQDFLRLSKEQRRQHIAHYCTKLGPDEDQFRHHLQQGSDGDRVLLVLQLLMIVLFLCILQVVHELGLRKKYANASSEVLEMLRFVSIDNHELPETIEEEDEDELHEAGSLLSVRARTYTGSTHPRSMSPTLSIDSYRAPSDISVPSHILEVKPWPHASNSNDA